MKLRFDEAEMLRQGDLYLNEPLLRRIRPLCYLIAYLIVITGRMIAGRPIEPERQ